MAAAATPKDLDTPREFPPIGSRKEWQETARYIQEQVLVSCGLWPMPEKAPLNAHVFTKVEREGYTVEKVYIETWPGFYLAGNLYRPLGRGRGPFPAILNPHGHWSNGRMADNKDGSIAGRCINFAKQGMIAFSYDMVGYNDTRFADTPSDETFSDTHHKFATNRADLLWNVSLMGVQTWNSIRALDFLQSLPDVDKKRLACTGESGGGTQTFILGAVDKRLAAQAPIVMVSHSMQGGCLCENAPSLRVQFSNMEIAAAAAPRPQFLVAASGDWTRDTMTIEGPSIGNIYSLLGARQNFGYVRYDFDHNYNQTTREAVYGFFSKCLLGTASGEPRSETPYIKEPDATLRVFPDGKLPPGAITQAQMIDYLKRLHKSQWAALCPTTRLGLRNYKETLLPAWRHTMQLEPHPGKPAVNSEALQDCDAFSSCNVRINRPGETGEIAGEYWVPSSAFTNRTPKLAILCDPAAVRAATHEAPAAPTGLKRALLDRGIAVFAPESFPVTPPQDQFSKYYSTYNRTLLQERVRDLLTIRAAAPFLDPRKNIEFDVALIGTGKAGLWAIAAAPQAGCVVADCTHLDASDEHLLLDYDVFCPGICNLGAFEGMAMLAAPNRLLLHNCGSEFSTRNLATAYSAAKKTANLKLNSSPAAAAEIVDWVARNKK